MSGWDLGTRCLVFEACAGWTEAVVERCEGIGSEASLWLRVKGSGEVVERLGREVEVFEPGVLAGAVDMAALEALSEGRMVECLRLRFSLWSTE